MHPSRPHFPGRRSYVRSRAGILWFVVEPPLFMHIDHPCRAPRYLVRLIRPRVVDVLDWRSAPASSTIIVQTQEMTVMIITSWVAEDGDSRTLAQDIPTSLRFRPYGDASGSGQEEPRLRPGWGQTTMLGAAWQHRPMCVHASLARLAGRKAGCGLSHAGWTGGSGNGPP